MDLGLWGAGLDFLSEKKFGRCWHRAGGAVGHGVSVSLLDDARHNEPCVHPKAHRPCDRDAADCFFIRSK